MAQLVAFVFLYLAFMTDKTKWLGLPIYSTVYSSFMYL